MYFYFKNEISYYLESFYCGSTILTMKYLISIFILAQLCSCKTETSSDNGVDSNKNKEEIISALETKQPYSDLIRLNQLGYFPNAKKLATVVGENKLSAFSITNLQTGEEVLKGNIGAQKHAALSGETLQQFDFTGLKKAGYYQIKLDNDLNSYPFEIGTDIYDDVLPLVAKAYYYQRAGSEITKKHGGQWDRPAGHLDKEVSFHPSTGKTGTISSPKGWYDAGDFGKYISNGSFATGQLLQTLERYPNLYPDAVSYTHLTLPTILRV